MELPDIPPGGEPRRDASAGPPASVRLLLYVARSTPNSVRAEHNLAVVLEYLQDISAGVVLEIVDVFAQPKRAITDNVVVTPTLIGSTADKRIVMMGDLADQIQLRRVLTDLVAPGRPIDAATAIVS